MRFYLVILFSLLISFVGFSQDIKDIKENDLPPKVVSSFYEKFTPSGKVLWAKTADIFIATFKADNQNAKATYTKDGQWTKTKLEINFQELPIDLVTYITSNFRDAKINESSLIQSPTDSDYYLITLKKDGITAEAEINFDMKGNFLKQNIPVAFNKTPDVEQSAAGIPASIYNTFKKKYSSAKIQSWKNENSSYTLFFIQEETKGKSEFAADGTWRITKFSIPDKELPSVVMNDISSNFKDYKIKTSEMIQESGVADYYYLFAKKEGILQPSVGLFYSLDGKLIKKITSEDKEKEQDFTVDNNNTEKVNTSADDTNTNNAIEKIDVRELPSAIINYIKSDYSGYIIKEAILNTTEKSTFYVVKVKKEGFKAVTELTFDFSGKFLESSASGEE